MFELVLWIWAPDLMAFVGLKAKNTCDELLWPMINRKLDVVSRALEEQATEEQSCMKTEVLLFTLLCANLSICRSISVAVMWGCSLVCSPFLVASHAAGRHKDILTGLRGSSASAFQPEMLTSPHTQTPGSVSAGWHAMKAARPDNRISNAIHKALDMQEVCTGGPLRIPQQLGECNNAVPYV